MTDDLRLTTDDWRLTTALSPCHSYHLRYGGHSLQHLLDRRFPQRAHAFLACRLHDVERRALPRDEAAQPLGDRHDLKDAVTADVAGLPAMQAAGASPALPMLKLLGRHA